MRRTVLSALGALAVATLAVGTPAHASPSTGTAAASAANVRALPPPPHGATRAATSGTVLPYTHGGAPLNYHGGAIAKSMTIYLIWWNPGHLQDGTVSNIGTTYKALLSRFATDYSGNGLAKNNTQYYGYSGTTPNAHISSTTHFGGAFTNTTPYPSGHCTSNADGANCVTDADVAAIAAATAKAHLISAGTNKIFMVYTSAREGSCFDSGPDYCAYSYYCAYHSYASATYGAYGNLIYSNQPWPTSTYGNCYAPGLGQTFPNGNTNGDASINVTSHELTEAITDPLINSWWDSAGYEIGDECAWEFGATTTGGGDVNWNTHPYSIQPEGSNASAGCVFTGP